jgi:hypothetical protein
MLTTPALATVLGAAQGWKRPYELIYKNRTNSANVTPAEHQYVYGKRFENGYYAPVPYIEVTTHMYQGGYATIVWESKSDRDAFDLVNTNKWEVKAIASITTANPAKVTLVNSAQHFYNGDIIMFKDVVGMEQLNYFYNYYAYYIKVLSATEFELYSNAALTIGINTNGTTYISGGTVTNLYTSSEFPGGYQMPRITFPYRAWEINIKARDTDYPDPVLFRGMRTRLKDITIGDKRLSGIQDAQYRFELELMSFDAWNLRHDGGSAIWYHRKNRTRDSYHLAFDTSHHITYDQAITQIVAWMNQGRPIRDFPITYFYAEKGISPYNLYLDAVSYTPPQTVIPTGDRPTWDILAELLNYMGATEGLGLEYIPTCSVEGVIDSILGGFDKEQPAYTDFRTHEDFQHDTDTTTTIDFTQIHAKFTGDQLSEYWYKFLLYKWNAGLSDWDLDMTLPEDGTSYEYVPYDSKNVYDYKDFNFIKKDAGRYKWVLDIVSAKTLAVDTVGSYIATSPGYTLQHSNSEIDVNYVETFFMTRGLCKEIRQTDENGDPIVTTCPSYASGLCPGQMGCYPDPITNALVGLTGTLSFVVDDDTVTGIGTLFLSELIVGDLIKHNSGSVFHEVLSITNDTELVLTAAFYDPCFEGGLSGASSRSGSVSSNETVNPVYGIISSQIINYANQSAIINSWDTICRLNSKREYTKSLNADSSIREPINVHLEFINGWTENLVGKYCEYYSPSANKNIIFRVLSQTHIMQGNRTKTTIDGFYL